jgi:NADH-quinone oxidoreductase subunit E
MLRGGEELLRRIAERLGIQPGERTADGLFSLEEVECMGACGGAPMIAINEDYYEHLTPERVEELLEQLRHQALANGDEAASA